MAAEFKILIGAELNTNELNNLKNQISNIKTAPIKLQIDTRNVQSQVQKIKNHIRELSNIKIILNNPESNDLKKTTNDYNKLLDLQKKISSLKIQAGNLSPTKNSNQIAELSKQIEKLKAEYDSLYATSSKNLSTAQIEKLSQVANNASDKIAVLNAKTTDTNAKLASGIQLKISNNTLSNQISDIEAKFKKLNTESSTVSSGIQKLKSLLNSMDSSDDIESVISDYKKFESILTSVKNKVSELKREQSQVTALNNAKNALSSQIDSWLKNNSAATGRFGQQLRQIQSQIASADSTKLNGLKTSFQEITRQAELSGKATMSLRDKLSSAFGNLGIYFSAATVFMRTTMAIRSMYDNVLKVDVALTELKKVSKATDTQLLSTFENSKVSARELATPLNDIISATADWSRTGYSLDEAEKLAKVSALYKNVGDNISIDTANKSLISTLQGFKLDVSEAESIIDKFNEVSNNYAIDSSGIGEALQRSASSFNEANTDLSKSIALITGANEVVQDPDKVGNMWKTVSMRIRGAKQELIEAGEDTDGMVESTSELRNLVKGLTGFDIMEDAEGTKFKDIYEIVVGIGEEWSKLSDIEQAGLLEKLAGKMHGNSLAAALNNVEKIKKIYHTAEYESEGSAQKENKAYVESLSGHLNQMKAAWQSLSTSFLTSDFLKGLVDTGTKVINIVDNIIERFGTLPTLIAAITAGLSVKNIGFFKNLNKDIDGFTNKTGIFKSSFSEISTAYQQGKGDKTGVKAVTAGVKSATSKIFSKPTITSADVANINAYNNAIESGTKAQDAFKATMLNSSKAAQQLVQNANGAKVATENLGNATQNASLKAKALSVASNLASTAFSMIANVGISMAITGIISAFTKLATAQKEARKKAIDTGNAAQESASKIITAYSEYNQAYNTNSIDKTAQSKENLSSATNNLISALGTEKSQLNSLTSDYESLNNKIKDLTKTQLQNDISDMKDGYAAASKKIKQYIRSGTYTYNEDKFTAAVPEFQTHGKYEFFHRADNSYESMMLQYQQLKEARVKLQDEFSSEELLKSKFYQDILELIEQYEEYADVLNIDKLNEALFNLEYIDYTEKNGIPKTREEIDALTESFSNLDYAGKGFKGTQEEIQNSLNSFLKNTFDSYDSNSQKKAGNFFGTILQKELDNKQLKEQLKDNEVKQWFDSLSPDDKELAYRISVKSDDTALWTLTQWKNEIDYLRENGETATESIQKFKDVMGSDESGGLSEKIESYQSELSALQDYISKIDLGTLDETDKINLLTQYPELTPYINNTNALKDSLYGLIQTFNQGINDEINKQIEAIGESSPLATAALEALRESLQIGFDFNLDTEIERFNALYDAMSESVSGTGLSTANVKTVESMFSSLKGYDPSVLFERTENGIHLNTKALRELQSQYEATNKLKFQNELENLQKKYDSTKNELEKLTEGTAEFNQKQSELTGLSNQIQEVQTLATQYEGLTSAYNKWILAQSSGEEGDMYDNITGSLENVKDLYDKGLVGTNAFRTAVQLMSNEDLSTANIEELIAAYESGYPKMQRYFTDSQEGCKNFLNDVHELNSEWAYINEDGNWVIDFGVGGDKDVADALGINVESLQTILRKLSDYGFEIKLDPAYTSIDELESKIEDSKSKLKELGEEPIDVDMEVNDGDFDSVISNIKKGIEDVNNSDLSPEAKAANIELLNAELEKVITQKIEAEKPMFMSIDSSQVDSELSNALTLLQQFQTVAQEEQTFALRGDTSGISDAQGKLTSLATEISKLPPNVLVAIGLNIDESSPISTVDQIKTQIASGEVKFPVSVDTSEAINIVNDLKGGNHDINSNIEVTISGQKELDTFSQSYDKLSDKTVTITAKGKNKNKIEEIRKSINNTSSKDVTVKANVYGEGEVRALREEIAKLKDKIVNIITNQVTNNIINGATTVINNNKSAKSTGTANVNGTAFSQGNWGTKESGIALGGELGQELIVRNGRYYKIGDNSTEFFKYQKGDIIFNAEQTKEIFEKGKITRNKKRGKALYEGTAFSHGSGGFFGGGSSSGGSGSSGGGNSYNGSSGSSSGGNSSNSSNNSNSSSNDFKETFDWIEIMINRIERAISTLGLKATNIYKSWASRNKNLTEQISKISEEIDIQSKGYERYLKEANSVGLSETWAKKVRDGEIDISKITDENLAEKIKEYQEWYEKAIDCRDAIEELKETESELYKQYFDNVMTEYDGLLSKIEHQKNMLESYISQSEEKGYITSTKYYQALIKSEYDNLSKLEKEKIDLTEALQKGINSGKITEGSEAWYEMSNSIDEVTESIEQSNLALLEYQNSIREIQWSTFDLLQERISAITKESDFFVNLFKNDKLYQDNGQLTDAGLTSMGMHGLNYDVYMQRADVYAKELLRLEKEFANSPNDTNLIKRKEELLELQQEMILAAEDEKQAIVEMVEEGIDLELDSLKNLIDTYEDALDAQKDLYDYQKKVAEQTKEISSLEKQLSAYQNDNSEETKSKVQQLKVSLEKAKTELKETEYDKYISDQKQLLNDLYDEYETILNHRLDDIDSLIADMITIINENSDKICDTLQNKSENVGYSPTDSMNSIWNISKENLEQVLFNYSDKISGKLNSIEISITKELDTICENVSSMVNTLNNIANNKINGEYVKTAEGDILIPILQDSNILANNRTKDISNLIKAPADIIHNNLLLDDYVPLNNKNIENTYIQNFDNISFVMPNVKNYNELLMSMQSDKNFENLISSLTFDKISGKNTLARKKVIK